MAEPSQRSTEHDRRIDYIEFPAVDLPATKRFYQQVFGWKFTDYGPDYAAFEDGRLDGGFHAGDGARKTPGAGSGTLAVLFAVDLADTEARVRRAGGTIVTPPFSFPGGRR